MSRLWRTDTQTHEQVKEKQYSAEAESAIRTEGEGGVDDLRDV